MPRRPDEAAIAELAVMRETLPVFAELEETLGRGHSPGIDGTPATMHGGDTRMCWVWFPAGKNVNFAVDKGGPDALWAWVIRANGPRGHSEQSLSVKPGQGELRAVAVGAGLLDYQPPLSLLDGWAAEDLQALVLTAGELWNSGAGDPYDVLSAVQKGHLDRAAALYRAWMSDEEDSDAR